MCAASRRGCGKCTATAARPFHFCSNGGLLPCGLFFLVPLNHLERPYTLQAAVTAQRFWKLSPADTLDGAQHGKRGSELSEAWVQVLAVTLMSCDTRSSYGSPVRETTRTARDKRTRSTVHMLWQGFVSETSDRRDWNSGAGPHLLAGMLLSGETFPPLLFG